MGAAHEPVPDIDRQAAAGRLPGGRGIVVADPHAGDKVRSIADEPGVAEILRRAGFAGRDPRRELRLLGGADAQGLAHHRVHLGNMARLDDAAEWAAAAQIKRLAGRGAHALDHVRVEREAAIGERRKGRNKLDHRDFRGAERQ